MIEPKIEDIIKYVETIINNSKDAAKKQDWTLDETIKNTNQKIIKFLDYLSSFMEIKEDLYNEIANVFPPFDYNSESLSSSSKSKTITPNRSTSYNSSSRCGGSSSYSSSRC